MVDLVQAAPKLAGASQIDDAADHGATGGIALDYQIDDYPGIWKTALFGIQHVLVMFTAMVGAPLIIARLLALSEPQTVTIVTGSMLACGIGTLLSSLGLGFIGPRLPIVMGTFFIFIGPIVSTAKLASLTVAMTAIMIGAVIQFAISPLFGKLHRFFPPIVAGTILVIIGTCLMKVAINSAVGFNTPAFAKPSTLILSSGMILIILVITRFATGFAKAISLFLAMTAGYVISAVFGLVNFDAIAKASWIAIPTLLPYGGLEWPGVVPIVVMTVCFLCAAAETTGHTIAVSKMCGVDPSEARIRGAVANDGLSSGLSALLGGMPLTSYSQNIGAIALTGVGSRFVVAFGGACLVVMALVPKLGAVISLIPGPVLGGALVFMFGMIASVGMSIIGNSVTARRNAVLFATSVGIALAISAAPPGTFDVVPPVLRILVGDGIVMGILTAVILNIFLPDEERSARKTELSIRPPQLEQAHRTV